MLKMRCVSVAAAVVAIAGVGLAAPARADVIDLTYTFSTGNTVAVALGGALQADGNTFDVANVQSVSVNGAAVADTFSVASTDSIYASVNTGPIVTINGSYLDLFVTDTQNGNVFAFAVGDVTSQYVGNVVGASVALGGDGGTDVFELTSFDPMVVPEPASIVMFAGMLGFMGVLVSAGGGVRRARRAVLA